MKRAAIYVRVSSERQAAEDRVSIESQLADCEALCKERNYVIVDRYIDREKYRSKGKLVQPSGQRKDRPEYRKMLKAALRGEFSIVVAWKEDRLYRGMYAAMPFSEVLDEMGPKLEVDLVRETFDRKMLGIKAALGKIESDNIRDRMLMGRRARLEKGEVPGGDQVKYGYQKVDKHLEIDKNEAKIINKIFEWYILGTSYMQMRRKLTAMEVPPRRGNLWSKATIETILTTDTYATGKYRTKLGDETFTIPCPPIISRDTWRKAQEIRKNNRSKPRNIKEDYLCVGLVYCACGWKCNTVASRSNKYKGYNSISGYYRCQRRNTNPENAPECCCQTTGSKKVDEYVWNFIKKVCDEPVLLKKAVAKKLAKLEAEQGDIEAEAEHLQKQLDEMAMERQWVITQARKGTITENDMEMQLGALQLQEVEVRKEIDEKLTSVGVRQQAKALSDWASQYLSDIHSGIKALEIDLDNLTKDQQHDLSAELDASQFEKKFPGDELAQLRWAILEEKRRVVKLLISKIVVGKGENGESRKITPILALDLPTDDNSDTFLAYGHQSPDYVPA